MDISNQAEQALAKYRRSVEYANDLIKKHAGYYRTLTENMMQLERERRELTKGWLRGYARCLEQFGQVWLSQASAFSEAAVKFEDKSKSETEREYSGPTNRLFDPIKCDQYNPEYSDPFLTNNNRSDTEASMLLGFEKPQNEVRLELSEDCFGGLEGEKAKAMQASMEDTLRRLVAAVPVASEDAKHMVEQIRKPLGRNLFAKVLLLVAKPTEFKSAENFAAFSDVLNSFLTALMEDKDSPYDVSVLYAILSIGQHMCTKVRSVHIIG